MPNQNQRITKRINKSKNRGEHSSFCLIRFKRFNSDHKDDKI